MSWGGPDRHWLVPEAEAGELARLARVVAGGAGLDLATGDARGQVVELFLALRALERAGRLLRDEALLRLLELPPERRPPSIRTLTDIARCAGIADLDPTVVGATASWPDAPAGGQAERGG